MALAKVCDGNPVGVLASPASLNSDLFRLTGVKTILPATDQISTIEKCIRDTIAGHDIFKSKQSLELIIADLKCRGAKKIILGCTELSVIFDGHNRAYLIDPLDLAAEQAITYAIMEEI